MSYTKTNWTESTLVTVPRLNNIENGIEGSYTELTAIQGDIDTLQTDVGTLQTVVPRKPNTFQGSYLLSNDSNEASLKTSFDMQDGERPNPKIYTDIFDVSLPEMSPGAFVDFSVDIKNSSVVAITEFAGAFINSFNRELNVNVVDWTAPGVELTTLGLRAQNVSSTTLTARSRRFNVLLTGY